MCTKTSLLVKPVFQHSVSDRDKRVVKNCLHVFHVRKLKVRLSDPNRSVFRTLYIIFCLFCSIKLYMQGTRRYEVFVKSTSGKNEDFRVVSLQFSTLQRQCLSLPLSPKMLLTFTGKFEKCVKILNEELPRFKARLVCSHSEKARCQ